MPMSRICKEVNESHRPHAGVDHEAYEVVERYHRCSGSRGVAVDVEVHLSFIDQNSDSSLTASAIELDNRLNEGGRTHSCWIGRSMGQHMHRTV